MFKKLSWLLLAIIPLMTGSTFASGGEFSMNPDLNSEEEASTGGETTEGTEVTEENTATSSNKEILLPDKKTKFSINTFPPNSDSINWNNSTADTTDHSISTNIVFPETTDEIIQKIILANALIGAINANNKKSELIENFWVPSDFKPNIAMKENAINANTIPFAFESMSFLNETAENNKDFSKIIFSSLAKNIDFKNIKYVRANANIRGMQIAGPIVFVLNEDSIDSKKMQAAYALIGQVIASQPAWFTGYWDGRESLRIPDSSLLFERRSGDDAAKGTFLGQTTDLVDYTGSSSDGTIQLRSVVEKLIDFLKKVMVPIAIILVAYSGIELFLSFQNDEKMDKKIKSLTGILVGFLAMALAVNFVDWIIFGKEGEILRGGVDPAEFAQRGFQEASGLFDLFTSFAVIIAVAFIVYNAITLIMAGGEDEGQLAEIKKRILYSVIGLILLISIRPIIEVFTTNGQLTMPEIRGTISIVAKWLNFLLGFIGIFAVVAMIYAGIQMIIHFGDDTQVENAKKIMTAAGIGLVLAFSSWVIVYYFVFA